ncbi:hypothetical protein CASFOL_031292 [Castilleja foliolosa]|uniref:Transmembrane protein n=1 Tax=Castilleja foliolosa TaxID=1961234 RepID=A0ABD3C5P7_9LAMI
MVCCLCFFQGSKTCLIVSFLAIPIFALFAIFSSSFIIIPITLSLLFILFTTLFPFTISKQTPNTPLNGENTLIANTPSDDDLGNVVTKKSTGEENGPGFSALSLCSESESLDRFSTTSSEEGERSSDIEWPYSVSGRLDCSDESISDEESLIEIGILSGQFVSQEKMFKYDDPKCCSKVCEDNKDFYADFNEDNLIEIDIYMGSIKCSNFGI